jgi:hypothetical protein
VREDKIGFLVFLSSVIWVMLVLQKKNTVVFDCCVDIRGMILYSKKISGTTYYISVWRSFVIILHTYEL